MAAGCIKGGLAFPAPSVVERGSVVARDWSAALPANMPGCERRGELRVWRLAGGRIVRCEPGGTVSWRAASWLVLPAAWGARGNARTGALCEASVLTLLCFVTSILVDAI